MRPTLAIIPLALLLSWIGPTPSGDFSRSDALSRGDSAPQEQAEPAFIEQVAQAWDSLQRGGSVWQEATSDVPQRR
jgi:hypothetical protein